MMLISLTTDGVLTINSKSFQVNINNSVYFLLTQNYPIEAIYDEQILTLDVDEQDLVNLISINGIDDNELINGDKANLEFVPSNLVDVILKAAGHHETVNIFQTWGMGDPSSIGRGIELCGMDYFPEKLGVEWVFAIDNAVSGGFSCGETSQALFDRLTKGPARGERLVGPRGGETGAFSWQTREFIKQGQCMINRLELDLYRGLMARITSGPHSFIVEPLEEDGLCRIHQTYDGGGGQGGFDFNLSVEQGENCRIEDFIRWFRGSINYQNISPEERVFLRAFKANYFFNHSVDPLGGKNNLGGLSLEIYTRLMIDVSEAQRVGILWGKAIDQRRINLEVCQYDIPSSSLESIINGCFSDIQPVLPIRNEYESIPNDIGNSNPFYYASIDTQGVVNVIDQDRLCSIHGNTVLSRFKGSLFSQQKAFIEEENINTLANQQLVF